MRFNNKTVLITGATSGMGRDAAKAFAKEGAHVIIVGRSMERGQAVLKEIQEANGCAEFIMCDVSDYSNVAKLYKQISYKYDGLDVLFNNAGIWLTQNLEELDIEDWERSFNAAMYMTKSFIGMLKKNKGCIITNASISGLDSFVTGRKSYMYAASKTALVKFSKLCAKNYAPYQVRVNVICPGIINTDIFEDKNLDRFNTSIPMGYVGQPEQVSKLVLFLASEDADYITGAVITIDGGMSLT